MATASRPNLCAQCGGIRSPGVADGLCAACLFRCALEDAPDDDRFTVLELSPLSAGVGTHAFGRFELLEVLGRGGMGVVYRARERASGRLVALKLAASHLISQAEYRRRFHAEMKAAASLDHPHVLPIYEIGEHDGLPFFTMKLAEGGSLAAQLDAFAGCFRDIASLAARVARAVHHAHLQGILHRDLKPGNILLDRDSHPYVSDFGVMKWMTENATLTTGSMFVGAPGYVAPEQARSRPNRPPGPAADVFSLGVILYELLTGKKPFAGATLWAAMARADEGSYIAPRSLRPDVPRDLETICRKCLEGDPSFRYASAAALADDLERFLGGRVILAQPASTWARAWKWACRNPWVAGLGTGVLVLLFAGVVGATVAAIHLARARDTVVRAEADARERLWRSLVSEARTLRIAPDVGHRHRALAALQRAAEIRRTPELRDEALRALTRTDLKPIAQWSSEVPFGAFTADLQCYALELSDGSCEVRRTSDHATLARLPAPSSAVFACWRFTPDSSTVSIIGKGGEAWLWRWRENTVVSIPYPLGQPPVCLEFSPDGSTLAAPGADGGVTLFDLAGRRTAVLAREIARPWAFAFSADGRALAVSDRDSGNVIVTSITTGETQWTIAHPHAISALEFSPDGRWLAAGVSDAQITLWSLPERASFVLGGHSRLCETLRFSPDSRVLASSSYDQTVRFWDVITRKPLLVMPAANATLFFNPSGSRLGISTEDARWEVFDFLTNNVRIDFAPERNRADGFPISLDLDSSGRLIALGGSHGVRIYDTVARREAIYLSSAVAGRHDVAFDPSSNDLIATVDDETLLQWTARQGTSASAALTYETSPRELRRGEFRLAGVASRGQRVALANSTTGVVMLTPLAEESANDLTFKHPAARHVIFDHDDRWLAVGGWKSPRVALWSLRDVRHQHDVPDSDNAAFALGNHGRSFLIGTPTTYRVFDAENWKELHAFPRTGSSLVTSYVHVAAAAPLGAVQWTHDSVRLFDLHTGTVVATLPVTMTTGLDLFQLSADGTGLVVAGEGHRVQWWDLRRLEAELTRLGLGLGKTDTKRSKRP